MTPMIPDRGSLRTILSILILSALCAGHVFAAETDPILSHRIRAVFDLETHTVRITDALTVPPGLESVRLGEGLIVDAVRVAGGEEIPPATAFAAAQDEDGAFQRLDLAAVGLAPAGGELELEYHGAFYEPVDEVVFSREKVGGEITATISAEGIYLSGAAEWLAWSDQALAVHDIDLDTPAGFETVTQGERVRHETTDGRLLTRWVARRPADGLNLIAQRFVVHEEPVREGVTSYTFFLEDDPRLRATYMERTKTYISMYEEMIGPYPYAKFATVENWFPTGYGMPSWTLLGGQVLRLPFIPYTSFGHEICHNWWGNSVFVDIENGNWCEGITVYCADYHYKELESPEAARDYRRTLLKDYAAYVDDPVKDFPLSEFKSRHSGATRAVGYGKSMMVFHMIDRMIGRENFLAGLRRVAADHSFTKASWYDFLLAFGAEADRDLVDFGEQWLTQAGAPTLLLSGVEFGEDDVSFRLEQVEPAYDLEIPIVVTGREGSTEHLVHLATAGGDFSLPGERIGEIAVDPDCHIFRHLAPTEIEPTLRQILSEEVPYLVLDEPADEIRLAAQKFTAGFLEEPTFSLIDNGELPRDLPLDAVHANVIVNPGADLLGRYGMPEMAIAGKTVILGGRRYSLDKYDLVYAAPNPFYRGLSDLVVLCESPERLEALGGRIVHYGKYSWLLLPQGQGKVEKGNWQPAGSPLVVHRD